MARISKPGLNYFPLDVDFLNDRKVRKVMRKQGALAASALIAILSSIYKDKGYYMQWDEDICFDLSEIVLMKMDDFESIIANAIEAEIFDKKLFDEYRILTSESIQNQYRLCTNRRKLVDIDERYRLIEIEITDAEGIAEPDSCMQESDSTDDDAYNLPLNVDSGTQSKVKESKEKKTSSQPFSKSGEGKEEKEPEGKEGNSIPAYCYNTATHNYTGLLDRLKTIGVKDERDIATILKMSDYGRIGDKVWKIIAYGNWPRGNVIKMPGKYIISQLRK